jgi:hypothetical protein
MMQPDPKELAKIGNPQVIASSSWPPLTNYGALSEVTSPTPPKQWRLEAQKPLDETFVHYSDNDLPEFQAADWMRLEPLWIACQEQ